MRTDCQAVRGVSVPAANERAGVAPISQSEAGHISPQASLLTAQQAVRFCSQIFPLN